MLHELIHYANVLMLIYGLTQYVVLNSMSINT